LTDDTCSVCAASLLDRDGEAELDADVPLEAVELVGALDVDEVAPLGLGDELLLELELSRRPVISTSSPT